MSARVLVELSAGEAEAKKARRRQTASIAGLIRIRLPFNFTPNPVAREREFLSVSYDAFTRLRLRAVSLRNAIRGELEQQGFDEWITNPRASHRVRTNADLWKTMVLSAILDAGRDKQRRDLVLDYFDGKESLAFALGRVMGLSEKLHLIHFERVVLNPIQIPLDRLSTEAVARLEEDALLHAIRTADNARAGEIFMFCFFAVVGFFELGGAELLAFLLRIKAPFFVGEGFGALAGADVPLMQGAFGAFMGFVGYTKEVGELLAKGDIAEEDVNGLLISLIGIFIPALLGGLSLDKLPAAVKQIGQMALLPAQVAMSVFSAIHKMLWLVSSFEELMESVALCRDIADEMGTSFLLGREEFEIILPGMPE